MCQERSAKNSTSRTIDIRCIPGAASCAQSILGNSKGGRGNFSETARSGRGSRTRGSEASENTRSTTHVSWGTSNNFHLQAKKLRRFGWAGPGKVTKKNAGRTEKSRESARVMGDERVCPGAVDCRQSKGLAGGGSRRGGKRGGRAPETAPGGKLKTDGSAKGGKAHLT